MPAPALAVGRYRLVFQTDAPPLRGFQGSAWRGAFGHALKKTVCITRLKHCPDCLLYRSCAYPYIFETPPPLGSGKMRLYNAAPHPFAFDLPLQGVDSSSDGRGIGVALFGHANQSLPYVIHALQRAGEDGVGPRRLAHRLRAVEQELSGGAWAKIYEPDGRLEPLPTAMPAIPKPPAAIRVRLVTPLRLQHNEQLVSENSFRFADFFGSLLRRISMLTYFHGDTPLETDFRALMDAACGVEHQEADLKWYDWTRYSSRQQTTIEMGGLVGEFTLEGSGPLAPFWPYLWLGQWTHAGKGASMGLGRYVIEIPASLPERTDDEN